MHFNAEKLAIVAAAFAALAESKPIGATINARDSFTDFRDDLAAYSCGLYSSAADEDTQTNYHNLQDSTETVTLPGHSCGRIACYNTSGIYVCNDQDVEITVSKGDAAGAAYKIHKACHKDDVFVKHPLSGRVYSSREGGYNVNVGFCDNNISTLVGPADYTYPGPDGEPAIHCGTELGFEACLTPEALQEVACAGVC